MKITKTMLLKLDACNGARRIVQKALPFSFYTDPEKNNDLAIKLVNLYRNTSSCSMKGCTTCHRDLIQDLRWIANRVNQVRADDIYELQLVRNSDFDHEPMLAAQAMAMIADVIKV